MKILAVDTTTKDASVSLKIDEKIYNNSIDNEITHSEKLLPLIDKTLKEANIKINDIDEYAIINGPGSFTGIRIGLSTIKAFLHVTKKQVFSMSSLELIALCCYLKNRKKEYTESNPKYIVSLIDAKNDRAYYCIYKVFEKDNKIISNNIISIKNDLSADILNTVKSTLDEENVDIKDVIFSGIINESLNQSLSNCTIFTMYPNTNDILDIIFKMYDTKKYTFNAFNLQAIYARPSQAERVKNGEK